MAKHNFKILRCSHCEKFLKYVWPFYILHERVKLSPVAKRSQRKFKANFALQSGSRKWWTLFKRIITSKGVALHPCWLRTQLLPKKVVAEYIIKSSLNYISLRVVKSEEPALHRRSTELIFWKTLKNSSKITVMESFRWILRNVSARFGCQHPY